MSKTEDFIYIKFIGNRWRVWLGSANDADSKPAKCDARFYLRVDAEQYAKDWSDSCVGSIEVSYIISVVGEQA